MIVHLSIEKNNRIIKYNIVCKKIIIKYIIYSNIWLRHEYVFL